MSYVWWLLSRFSAIFTSVPASVLPIRIYLCAREQGQPLCGIRRNRQLPGRCCWCWLVPSRRNRWMESFWLASVCQWTYVRSQFRLPLTLRNSHGLMVGIHFLHSVGHGSMNGSTNIWVWTIRYSHSIRFITLFCRFDIYIYSYKNLYCAACNRATEAEFLQATFSCATG